MWQTLPETNIVAPEKWMLGIRSFPFGGGLGLFSGANCGFREGMYIEHRNVVQKRVLHFSLKRLSKVDNWLIDKDPDKMAYYNPIYSKWVVFHTLYTEKLHSSDIITSHWL